MMADSDVATRILFDYEAMARDELVEAAMKLPRKTVRWLAMHHPDNRVRKWLFRATGVRIGSRSVLNIHLRVLDDYEPLVVIGDRVSIAPNVTLVAAAAANNALLSELPEGVERLIRRSPVRIENDAWIGAGAIVLPGVTIGAGAIVGAGAVVTREVEPRTVVAGVPARRLRGAV